jgi:Integrin alpha
LEGKFLDINATAFSASEEVNPDDNTVIDTIPLQEFSEVEMLGKSSKLQISLEDGKRVENITHQFEIRNNGPSHIKEMEVTVMIPISYIVGHSSIDIVNFEEVDMQASYINKVYEISWTKNNLILIKNAYESSSAAPKLIENLNSHEFHTAQIGVFQSAAMDNNHMDHTDPTSFRRKRREAFQESPLVENRQQRSVQTFHDENILNNLPLNRTIFFKCHTIQLEEENHCVRGTFSVRNFRAGSAPIMVNIKYTVDSATIDQLFNEKQDIFVFQSSAVIRKLDDETGDTLKTVYTPAFTVFYKKLVTETPLWIYIVSIISGLLILVIITATFYKVS